MISTKNANNYMLRKKEKSKQNIGFQIRAIECDISKKRNLSKPITSKAELKKYLDSL